MKKAIIFLILTGLIIFGWQGPLKYTMGDNEERQEPLQGALQVTGAEFNDLTFSGWVQINHRFSSDEELKNYANQLSVKLGANNQSMEQISQGESNFRGIILRGFINPSTYLEIHSQTMQESNNKEDKAETYVTAMLISKDNQYDIDQGKSKMEAGFRLLSSQPAQIATILSGTLPGQKSLTENKAVAEKVFKFLGTKPFEGISTERLVSLTGYTPEIEEKLVMGEKQLNINVAVRYNNLDKKTYVIIGSPIIATEY
ncbi:MAG: YwmB family TATA-box binding protein [Clostridia bacterium]|nr:YwmB family TATA-box binding protein [Clostridia bacterium]